MNVVGLPTPEPERYVRRGELAGIMGVSVRQVDKWKAEGMPYEDWGMRAVRFKPSAAIQWVRTRQNRAA